MIFLPSIALNRSFVKEVATMAWDKFVRNGVEGFSGDKPIDEIALALKKVTKAYEERFSRKPTVAEILHALETIIGAAPAQYVSDPDGLELAEFVVKRKPRKENA
jgi:hypothetical protein